MSADENAHVLTLAKAINPGLRRAMEADPKVLVMGEDVGLLGGVFRVTDGLQKDFGEDRVIDTPLAESGHHRHRDRAGAARLPAGLRDPVRRVHLPRLRPDRLPAGQDDLPLVRAGCAMPIVIRVPFGGGIGAVEHHSESPEALLRAHRRAAGGLLRQPRRRLLDDPAGGRLERPGDALRAEAPLLGQGRGRPGRPVAAGCTRHGWSARAPTSPWSRTGRWCGPCLEAAAAAEAEGRSIEVIDLRILSPLDLDPCWPRVRRTGRLVVVHEAPTFLGLGAEVAARVTEQCFYHLEAPVLRVGGFAHPLPAEPDRGRTTCPTWTGCWTPSTASLPGERSTDRDQGVPAAGRRRGADRGRDRHLAGAAGGRGQGQPVIVEIETAKSLVELPCPCAGVVTELLVARGETVPVGTPIIAVDVAGRRRRGRPDRPLAPAEGADQTGGRAAVRRRTRGAGRLRRQGRDPDPARPPGRRRTVGRRPTVVVAGRAGACRRRAHRPPDAVGRSGACAGQAAGAQAGPRPGLDLRGPRHRGRRHRHPRATWRPSPAYPAVRALVGVGGGRRAGPR